MKQIKNYFKNWGVTRIIRIVLAVFLGIAYYYNHETVFLFAGIILTVQAVFNISCPGGSCGTTISSENKPIVKVEKYEPKK
ncbi:MAG: hypothetical protein ACOYMD_06170 [Paludibacter sp.]